MRIDQTPTQDATGTLVMLGLEAMGLDRVKNELSVQYRRMRIRDLRGLAELAPFNEDDRDHELRSDEQSQGLAPLRHSLSGGCRRSRWNRTAGASFHE